MHGITHYMRTCSANTLFRHLSDIRATRLPQVPWRCLCSSRYMSFSADACMSAIMEGNARAGIAPSSTPGLTPGQTSSTLTSAAAETLWHTSHLVSHLLRLAPWPGGELVPPCMHARMHCTSWHTGAISKVAEKGATESRELVIAPTPWWVYSSCPSPACIFSNENIKHA